ncbi:MAG: hypothetical protein WBB25_22370 [Sulfitobacter sp.]
MTQPHPNEQTQAADKTNNLLGLMLRTFRLDMSARVADKWSRDRQAHPNSFARFGQKCFSQSDEDGITMEIVRRLNLENGTFAELGVGNGLENNSLILLALGWKGFWLGGEELVIDHQNSPRLSYFRDWISLANIDHLMQSGINALQSKQPDVISIDLDGNDIYLTEKILADHAKPALFVVEVNNKFPPPVRFSIPYDEKHRWKNTDYYGASLQSFADLFESHGYFPVVCNTGTGTNAFFVRKEFRDKFSEVPEDIREHHVPPNYSLPPFFGHPTDVKTVNRIINS